jgi:dipeptidyl aminopeptidase/acylaminoacyl peptidase
MPFLPRLRCVLAAIVLVSGTAHLASAPATFPLTVDSIMRGPKLVGYPQTGLRWAGDSSKLYFEWRRPGDDEASTWTVNRDGTQLRNLSDDERRNAPPVNGAWDKAHRRVLFVDQGDIVLVDSVDGTRRQVTRTTGAEANPRWARRETAITFTRENNLFVMPLAGGEIAQLTDVHVKKRDARETDSQKFLKDEEQKLIEHTRVEAEKKKKTEEKDQARALPKFELADRQTASDLQLSPDGKHVFIIVVERSDAAKRENVPNYVTESGYTEDIPARTFVGDALDKRTLAVMNIETGKTVPAELLGINTRDTKDTKDAADTKDATNTKDAKYAADTKDAANTKDATGSADAAGTEGTKDTKTATREVRWGMPQISEDGAIAVANVRAVDNKDRWLAAVDPESGTARVLDTLHDDAWVREVGGTGPAEPSFGWMPDQKRLWFLSERDGWMHLYTLDASAAQPKATQLTDGKWEIESLALSADKNKFYITSTEVHPGERHIYAMPAGGGARTRLTSMTGGSAGEASPDDGTFAIIYSAMTKPHEVYLMPNRPGAPATQVTTTPTDEWRSAKWVEPQLITYKTRDGVDVYARLFTPEMVGAKRDPAAPAVVFVHGAGYLQNAHKYWSSYYREYMFHNLLAARGYVVLDPDYRASSGYGRDWRTAIYRHMGGKDLEDVVDGAKFLVDRQRVNPKRIGVYGGSYGGFITLMAMFTTPDVFAAGAALRPVTDWSHYNHGYTANILNEPHRDTEAYRRSSPIYFAEGLKGALLILHGMVDTNVLFQDSVRLAQRLIELRKENWWIAPYPVENHGFEEETSWADEYKRILKLFEDNLKTHDSRRAS